jgi:hypothetical protein
MNFFESVFLGGGFHVKLDGGSTVIERIEVVSSYFFQKKKFIIRFLLRISILVIYLFGF